jgi:ubiquinol-cytochrome c reductase iron-sulfur subunit
MSESEALGDANRRNFLIKVTSVVGGAGVVAAAVPFVASMNPSSDVLAKATTEVDLSGIPEGGVHTVAWQGKPVFILHRTQEEIKAMEDSAGGFEPEPDQKRVIKPEWLVVVGVCTHLGCTVNLAGQGFHCPCHGSVFDQSGAVVSGPAPSSLAWFDLTLSRDGHLVINTSQAVKADKYLVV